MVSINGKTWTTDIEGLARMVSTYGRGSGESVVWEIARGGRSSITQADVEALLATLTEVAVCTAAPDTTRTTAAAARDALARLRGRGNNPSITY